MKTDDLCIRAYRTQDEPAVIDVWRRCGLVVPHNDPRQDIQRKLRVEPDLFLVGTLGETLAATCMAGYEGHRGWINYLAVAPECRRQGIASALMAEVESALRTRGCPKINLQVRATNAAVIAFYERLGFVRDDVLSLGKRLIPDVPLPRTSTETPETFAFTIEDAPTPRELQVVFNGLIAHSNEQAGEMQHRLLSVFMRDARGNVLGGLNGRTYWRWLHIHNFWLPAHLRGQGRGRRILRAAEAEAVRRGCREALVDTFTFQAPAFYEKEGYSVFGVIDDFPEGCQRFFLKKRLK